MKLGYRNSLVISVYIRGMQGGPVNHGSSLQSKIWAYDKLISLLDNTLSGLGWSSENTDIIIGGNFNTRADDTDGVNAESPRLISKFTTLLNRFNLIDTY